MSDALRRYWRPQSKPPFRASTTSTLIQTSSPRSMILPVTTALTPSSRPNACGDPVRKGLGAGIGAGAGERQDGNRIYGLAGDHEISDPCQRNGERRQRRDHALFVADHSTNERPDKRPSVRRPARRRFRGRFNRSPLARRRRLVGAAHPRLKFQLSLQALQFHKHVVNRLVALLAVF